MSRHALTSDDLQFLKYAVKAERKSINIRLREGEYQFDLAKAIASFELELSFPDVKDLAERLYGEERVEDVQFIRKIQTILKKMEKSGIIRILPKNKPWELQRYALSSFKFQDAEKNQVDLATEEETSRTLSLVHSSAIAEQTPRLQTRYRTPKVLAMIFMLVASYAAILWTLTQPINDLNIFMAVFSIAFSIAAILSLFLGILVARK